jgi:hypothetical protein
MGGIGLADSIIIVSGLPRSGTSMMMKMLHAGGVPLLTDNVRVPDIDNPGGYFEFEPVKNLSRDPSWLQEAEGKAVKMVYLLLYDLPATHTYRVIFMGRPLEEVLQSQAAMLQRREPDAGPTASAELSSAFRKELEAVHTWLSHRQEFSVLHVDYHEVLNDPRRVAGAIDEFCGPGLDVEAMARVPDPGLYRARA